MDVKTKDIMAIVHYFKVDQNYPNMLTVTDLDRNYPFQIKGKELIDSAFSADQFSEVKKSTKTSIAEKLVNSGHKPFTVCFVKQDGSDRVLRGRMVAPETMLGRSRVEDLDEPVIAKRLKQVDHRTIKWLILDNVKYVVKGK